MRTIAIAALRVALAVVSFFKRRHREPPKEPWRYQVRHLPEYGYLPVYREKSGWTCAIKRDGTGGVSAETAVRFAESYFHDTERGAGETVNRHATANGSTVVWSDN